MNIKGIIFDYGGTLDTCGCHWGKMIWHSYERNGVPVDEQLFREAYVFAERELAKNPIIKPTYTFHDTLSAKIRIEMGYIESRIEGFDASKWCDAVVEDLYSLTKAETQRSRDVLLELKEHYPMVLVSNFYGNISTVLKEFGFDGIFGHIVESAVVGVRKPDPQIFTLGVEALGMHANEVLVVGDSYDKDIVAAKKAGCQTIWIKGEGWTDEDPDGQAADRVIKTLDEVLSIKVDK